MYGLWVILVSGASMVVYLVVLVRASHRGEAWATEALKAMACMSEGSAAAWFRMVEEPEQELLARHRRLDA
jgi:hypothetical protein